MAITAFNALLAFCFWIPVSTFAPVVVLALLYGASCGVFWAVGLPKPTDVRGTKTNYKTIAPLCAEVVPLNQLASVLCLQWLTVALPSLCAQAIALEIRTSGRWAFLYPQIYTGLAYTLGTLFLLELRRRKVGLFKRERHR